MRLKTRIAIPFVAALAVSALVLGGCGSSDSDSGSDSTSELSGTVNVAGSDTMVNMAQAWAEKFNEENPGVVITVSGGGSGNGIASFINQTVDVANASRELKEEEISAAKDAGLDPVVTEVARDGVTVIVNSKNSVSDITKDDLGKVYRGEITNWKELGGVDAPIVLLGRDSSSGTYAFINDEVIGKGNTYAKSMRSLQSNQAIVDEVGKNANAIGYCGLGYDNSSIKVMTVEGVEASTSSVLDGTYPLSRGLNMITNGQPTGALKAYVDWILGAEGQALVAEQGFVPLAE